MNGYELNRNWFNFSFENKDAKPVHTAIYMYAIEHCNKLGWKKEFGFPTDLVMEILSIKSYNTYSKALKDLVDFGFIKMIEKSKNQWTANIIGLSNFTKADNKALDEATSKHTSKQLQSTHQSIDSINKLLNKETIKLINKQTDKFCLYIENNLNLIFDLEKKSDPKITGLENLKDFEKKISEYFSQTTEILQMRLSSVLRSYSNEGVLDEFVRQTLAYIDYKKISKEKIHSWSGYQYEWRDTDWVDKLSKIKTSEKKEIKKEIHSGGNRVLEKLKEQYG